MVVLTSVFVAEIERSALLKRKVPFEVLPADEREQVLEESGRELICIYEGKNRVEPME